MATAKWTSRTKARPEQFPAGNAVVGDRVYFWKLGQLDQEPRLGRVVEVGLRNEHGHYLDMRVKPDSGRPFVTSAVGHPDDIVIVEPAALEEENRKLFDLFYDGWFGGVGWTRKSRYRALVARRPCNSQEPRYRLVCTKCWAAIRRLRTSEESSDLHVETRNGAIVFREGKPSIEGSDSRLACDCKAGPDSAFVKFMDESVTIEDYA